MASSAPSPVARKKPSRHAATAADGNSYIPGEHEEIPGGEGVADSFKDPPEEPSKMPSKGSKKGRHKMSKTRATGEAPVRRSRQADAPLSTSERRELETLRIRMSKVERSTAELVKRNKQLQRDNLIAKRESELKGLMAEGYDLDLNDEMADAAAMGDDQWTRHVGRIRKRYSKTIVASPGVTPISAIAPPAVAALTKDEALAIAKKAAGNPALYDELIAARLNGTNGTGGAVEHVA
jgi:hypothetical protein